MERAGSEENGRSPGTNVQKANSEGSPWRRRITISALLIVAGLVVAYAVGSWIFSVKLLDTQFSSSPEIDFAHLELPEPEAVSITNNEITLSGWYFANPEAAGCAAILLHGYSGNRAEVLSASSIIWDRGCDLLLYDLRGHGQSSAGSHTYGALDKKDQLAAIDWLIQKTGLPSNKIGLLGWSYGAATSILTAAERPDLAFVVADSSYSSLQEIANHQASELFGDWAQLFVPGALFVSSQRADFKPSDSSPKDAVKGLTTPLLLIHSTTDEFTPYQHSEAIYANSDHAHTTLILTEWGAPHARSQGTDPVAYAEIVGEFINTFAPDFGNPVA